MRRHHEPGMLRTQPRRELRGDTRRRSKKEEPESPTRTQGCQERDEVNAGDRRADRAALAPGGPNHACTVSQAQVGGFQDPCEFTVPARTHHKLRIDGGDEMMPAAGDELFDATERGLHVDAVDPDPEYASLGAYLRRSSAGLVIGGSATPTISKSRALTTMLGIGVPRLPAKSDRLSPPPTRTRVQV